MIKNLSIILFLLLIPAIGMLFTHEINWTIGDFLVMGILLSVLVFGIHYIKLKITKPNYRIALIVLLIVLFLLIWGELAVGIFNTAIAGS